MATSLFTSTIDAYVNDLDRRLSSIAPGTVFRIVHNYKTTDVDVVNEQLQDNLPELVEGSIAAFTIWDSTQGFGVKERYDLGTNRCDEDLCRTLQWPQPRWDRGEVKKLVRQLAGNLCREKLPEVNQGVPPWQGIRHAHATVPPCLYYLGSSIHLRHDAYVSLLRSPIEHRLRQHLDFIYTCKQEAAAMPR